jgi:CRP/FNR family transcriptional regulator
VTRIILAIDPDHGEEGEVLAPEMRDDGPLPADHPCVGCEVRHRAVCGVLGCQDLARFKSLGRTATLSAGQALFHEGDPATQVFTLTRGAIKLYKLLPDGRRHVTGFLYAGDFLGVSVADEHAFTAEALENAQLCWFPRTRFDHFAEAHPAMERNLYRTAAHELAAAQRQMLLLARKTATERLATFLVSLADRSGGESVNRETIRLPMSRADIADYLGLTKETVSREFSALRGARFVRLRATDEVEIIDREGLERLSEGAA